MCLLYHFIQYSSRDEALSSSSESKSTPRFGSLASPSSYRPSYSGGTYRSLGIRRDVPSSPSYSSRWLNPNKESLSKETIEPKKSPVKAVSTDSTKSSPASKSTQIGTTSNLLNSSKTKAKEQSALSRPPVTLAKVRIRDVNSSSCTYSAPKSRDPSPCEPSKDRYTSSSGYVSSSYSKLYPRSSNKLQVNSISNGRQSLSSASGVSYLNGSDVGGRYRQNIDSNEKLTKTTTDDSPAVSEAVNATAKIEAPTKASSPSSSSSSPSTTATTSPEKTISSSDSSENEPEPCVEMIEVTVVTRATSPNLCPSSATTSFTRCRRIEIAKTIEKTIKRPKRWQHKAVDKEVQSDRMDDTSKYCRYSSSRATTPWPSSYAESRYGSTSYSRYSSTGSSNLASISKYSDRTSKSEKDSNENSPEKSIDKEKTPSKSSRESSISKSPSISRSNSIKGASKSDSKSKSKSPPSVAPTQSPKSSSTSPTKQKLYSNKALPPQPPKLESPTKVISATSSTSTPASSMSPQTTSATGSKWANKDFRKSALNVGPTDRPRKARTSSSASTENEDCSKKAQQKPTTAAATANQMLYGRSDRSPSVGSETSYSSGGNAADEILKNNFMKLKISSLPTSPTTAMTPTPTAETAPTVTATVRLSTSPSANSNEVIHANSDMMTYDTKSQPNNVVTVIQPNDSSHSNSDSCTKIDNAKSTVTIVNRVLGPVVNLFKTKSNQLGDSQSGSDHDSAISANDSMKQDTSLLNRTTITSSAAKLVSSKNYLADESNSNSWIDSTVNEQTTDTQFDRFQSSSQSFNTTNNMKSPNSDNPPVSWWFNEPENDYTVAEDITLNQSDDETIRIDNNNLNSSSNNNNNDVNRTSQSIPWWMVDDTTSTQQKYRITHIRSGERAWWMDDDTEESVNDILEAAAENDDRDNDNDDNNNTAAKFTLKLKKVDTGERSWWFCEENQDTEPNESIKHTASSHSITNTKEKTPDIDFWASINESLEAEKMRTKYSTRSSDGVMRGQAEKQQYDINANYIPLGDRASPEGLEDLNNNSDNFDASNVDLYFKKLFISKHQNIDEVLGAPCHALSPIRLDHDDNEDEPFQEILPNQVRIHDGTAKTIHHGTERYGISNDLFV